MKASKIYVVFGTTGEYSDRSEWMVKAFHTEKEADDLAATCNKEAAAVFVESDGITAMCAIKDDGIPHDPACQWDYTGTDYYVRPVALMEATQ